MHDVLRSKKYKSHPKNFTITSSILKNPKIFNKKKIPKKVGQMHEMHENEGLGPLPSEEKLDLGQKIHEDEVWSERGRFWEVKRQ